VIPVGKHVIYDFEEEIPILGLLTIDGILEFNRGSNLELKAKQIYVRDGELLIGTEHEPFQEMAQITLYGDRSEENEVMDGAVEAGSKQIVNTGGIEMHGVHRNRAGRLQDSVKKNFT